jgi:hypothetical protein
MKSAKTSWALSFIYKNNLHCRTLNGQFSQIIKNFRGWTFFIVKKSHVTIYLILYLLSQGGPGDDSGTSEEDVEQITGDTVTLPNVCVCEVCRYIKNDC